MLNALTASSFHPIIDRSRALREAVDRLELDCPDSQWLGWMVKHRFICPKGHVALRTPRSLCVAANKCNECKADQRIDALNRQAARAGLAWLDQRWMGTRATYTYRCKQGHRVVRRHANPWCPLPPCATCDARRKARRLKAWAVKSNVLWLDNVWLGDRIDHQFQCARGHKWLCRGKDALVSLDRCGECKRNRRTDQVREAAQRRGVELVSATWRAGYVYHQMRCIHGHTWELCGSTPLNRVAHCHACLHSVDYQRLLEVTAQAAITWLDDAWLGPKVLYRFRCGHGHRWERMGNLALISPHCRRCIQVSQAHQQILASELERLTQALTYYRGECLEPPFTGAHTEYLMRCAVGHTWRTTAFAVISGQWCPHCTGDRAPAEGLALLQEVAGRRGGVCLENHYQGINDYYHFRCQYGHEWPARATNILQNNGWCRLCVTRRKRLTFQQVEQAAHDCGALKALASPVESAGR